MSSRSYARLSIEEFGEHLLQSNDLDPIYVALVEADLETDHMKRWLVAYWCFYDAGVASYISEHEGDEFFRMLMIAAINDEPAPTGERWRRAKERRHARGKQGIEMVHQLFHQYEKFPEAMVEFCTGDAVDRTCQNVMRRTKEHYLFGDWIGFKVADMIDRCLGIPVSFDEAATFMFKDPTKAAFMLWRIDTGAGEDQFPLLKGEVIHDIVERLIQTFHHHPAPPLEDRPVGLQEVETVLCKWKSHMHGHYPLFNDQDEINEGLQLWLPHSTTAQRFFSAMPKR